VITCRSSLERTIRRAEIELAVWLVFVFALFFLAMQLWPPAYAEAPSSGLGQAFDWDRYHGRQDACRELDQAQRACVTYG
jgi:hypothetical protein